MSPALPCLLTISPLCRWYLLLWGSQHGTKEGEGEDGEFHLEVCVRENLRSSGMPMSLGSDVLHVHYLV